VCVRERERFRDDVVYWCVCVCVCVCVWHRMRWILYKEVFYIRIRLNAECLLYILFLYVIIRSHLSTHLCFDHVMVPE